MNKTKRRKLPGTAFIHLPPTPAFKAIWIVAAQKFPGFRLTYTGTAEDGDNYLQEWGNRVPFIVTDAELKAALVATA